MGGGGDVLRCGGGGSGNFGSWQGERLGYVSSGVDVGRRRREDARMLEEMRQRCCGTEVLRLFCWVAGGSWAVPVVQCGGCASFGLVRAVVALHLC